MLNNIPQVTKNLLLLNILVFILTLILGSKGVDLNQLLSTHAIGSPLFKPYQVVTYMFAHADFLHILMNMWLFVMLGGYLERLWGPKRFFIFFLLKYNKNFPHLKIFFYQKKEPFFQKMATYFPTQEITLLVHFTLELLAQINKAMPFPSYQEQEFLAT